MTLTTSAPQILDRSVLLARYRAARAAGNDVRATAILGIVNYLDHRSRARITSGRSALHRTVADYVDSLVRLFWWWAAPALTPARRTQLH